MLRRIATRLLHPYPRFPFLPLHMFSPADVVAERIGAPAVERLLRLPAIARMASALVRYLDDAEGERALKKELHTVLEPRLRAVALTVDPARNHGFEALDPGPLAHPLDTQAWDELSAALPDRMSPPPLVRPGLAGQWLNVLAAAVLLVIAAVVPLRRARPAVEPVRVRVAATNIWTVPFWLAFKAVAEEKGLWSADALAFVLDQDATANSFRQSALGRIEPAGLAVPAGEWLRRVVGPALALAARILANALSAPTDPRALEAAARALNLGARAVPIWRMAFNLRCRWFLECADDSSLPILRRAILTKFGAASVRWPYSQNESPGIYLSFLPFDVFLAGGSLQAEGYRGTWRPGCRCLPVGQIRNDRRFSSDANVDPAYYHAITSRLARGERMVVFFGGNIELGFKRPTIDALRTTLEAFAARPGWFVVVKPKGLKALHAVGDEDERIRELMDADNVIAIRYGPDGTEVTPPGWLIPRMALGVTLPGSVQIEALVSGHAVVAYWPVNHPTLLRERLARDGLMVSDVAMLRDVLREPEKISFDSDWYRWAGDAHGDDRALERVADALLGEGVPENIGTGVDSHVQW